MVQVFRLAAFIERARDHTQSILRWLRGVKDTSSIRYRDPLQQRLYGLEIPIALADGALHSSRYIFRSSTQFFRGFLQELEVMPSHPRCSPAANKFDAPILAHLAAAPHQNNPDLRRTSHVCAAARLQVRAFNLNRPQNSLALH